MLPERSALASDSVVARSASSDSLRLPQLLGERAELRVPIAFEIVDLGLHGLERLVHRSERAQHRLLAALTLFSRRLVAASLRGQLAVEQLLVVELRLNAVPGRVLAASRARSSADATLARVVARAPPATQPARSPAARHPITISETVSASMCSGWPRRPTSPGATVFS